MLKRSTVFCRCSCPWWRLMGTQPGKFNNCKEEINMRVNQILNTEQWLNLPPGRQSFGCGFPVSLVNKTTYQQAHLGLEQNIPSDEPLELGNIRVIHSIFWNISVVRPWDKGVTILTTTLTESWGFSLKLPRLSHEGQGEIKKEADDHFRLVGGRKLPAGELP